MNNRKDIKKKDRHEMFSRRDFLKCTGTIIIFVIGSGCYVHAEKSLKNIAIIDEKRAEILPSHGYLLVDTMKCQGCKGGTVIWSTFLIICIPSPVLLTNIYPAEKTENGITLTPAADTLRGINLMSLKPDFTNFKDGIQAPAILPEELWNL